MLSTGLFRSVSVARADNLEALAICSSMLTISILFYPEMFCMRGLEDLFLHCPQLRYFSLCTFILACAGALERCFYAVTFTSV